MTETSTALAPIVQVREELAPMRAEFGAVLPSHITPDKFMQVCITALENAPELLRADRQSFKVACLNAANDGLLPDKREGAFVIFNTEIDVRREGSNATFKQKVPLCVWMPMIGGILKKAYQTGKVQSISVELVYENDVYRRAAGDNAEIVHEPLDFGDRGKVRGGYAIIRMTSGGEPHREVMSLADIEKVRSVSKSKDRGPWVQFWDQMAAKTILRRALKRVPLTPEVDRVLSRDDIFYNLDAEGRVAIAGPVQAAIPAAKLFGNRAAVRRKPMEIASAREDAQPEEDQGLPARVGGERVQDAGVDASEGGPADGQDQSPDESALVAAITAIRNAVDAGALLEAETAALALATSDDERAWVEETKAARLAELMPPAETFDEGFVLTAVISSAVGPKTYEDPDLWRDDILNKLAVATGDALKKFWAVNLGHILDAGENGLEEHADRVLDIARGKGLPTEMPNG